MDGERAIVRVATDLVGNSLAVIDGGTDVEMIDAIFIDNLFVAEMQIEEIVFHVKPRTRAPLEISPAWGRIFRDNALCPNTG